MRPAIRLAARSASDATRFTATGPYVARKGTTFKEPPKSASKYGPAPPGETPAQKVARLRALAQKERDQVPRLEKIINYGRIYADRIHRTFIMTIVTFSAIGTVYMIVLGAEMIMHNRKKRREWSSERESVKAKLLFEANIAAREGTATEEQIMLLAQERELREKQEAKIRERMERKGVMTRVAELLVSDLNKEDTAAKKGKLAEAPAKAPAGVTTNTVAALPMAESNSHEKVVATAGVGMLDHIGQDAAEGAKQKTKSWSDWIMRR